MKTVGLRRQQRQSRKQDTTQRSDAPVPVVFRVHGDDMSKAPFLFHPKNFGLPIPEVGNNSGSGGGDPQQRLGGNAGTATAGEDAAATMGVPAVEAIIELRSSFATPLPASASSLDATGTTHFANSHRNPNPLATPSSASTSSTFASPKGMPFSRGSQAQLSNDSFTTAAAAAAADVLGSPASTASGGESRATSMAALTHAMSNGSLALGTNTGSYVDLFSLSSFVSDPVGAAAAVAAAAAPGSPLTSRPFPRSSAGDRAGSGTATTTGAASPTTTAAAAAAAGHDDSVVSQVVLTLLAQLAAQRVADGSAGAPLLADQGRGPSPGTLGGGGGGAGLTGAKPSGAASGGGGGGGGGNGNSSTMAALAGPTSDSMHPSGGWICRAMAFTQRDMQYSSGAISVSQSLTAKCPLVNDVAKGRIMARVMSDYAEVEQRYGLSHAELSFEHQYVSRSDMFLISEALRERIIYSGEEIHICGFRFKVNEMLQAFPIPDPAAAIATTSGIGAAGSSGESQSTSQQNTSAAPPSAAGDGPLLGGASNTAQQSPPQESRRKLLLRVNCGLITPQTSINFISLSPVHYVIIELTNEMWSTTLDGRIGITWAIRKFLRELILVQLPKRKATPLLRVVFTGRLRREYAIHGNTDIFHMLEIPKDLRSSSSSSSSTGGGTGSSSGGGGGGGGGGTTTSFASGYYGNVFGEAGAASGGGGAGAMGGGASGSGGVGGAGGAASSHGTAAAAADVVDEVDQHCHAFVERVLEQVKESALRKLLWECSQLARSSGSNCDGDGDGDGDDGAELDAELKVYLHEGIRRVKRLAAKHIFSHAKQSNTLEALAIVLERCSHHYLDRRLAVTGHAVTVVSAGKGIYQATNSLVQINCVRLHDAGLQRVHVVCMGRPPLHITPLLEYTTADETLRSQYHLQDSDVARAAAAMIGGIGSDMGMGMDKPYPPHSHPHHQHQQQQRYYEQPEWMSVYFYHPRVEVGGGTLTFELLTKEDWLLAHHFSVADPAAAVRVLDRGTTSASSPAINREDAAMGAEGGGSGSVTSTAAVAAVGPALQNYAATVSSAFVNGRHVIIPGLGLRDFRLPKVVFPANAITIASLAAQHYRQRAAAMGLHELLYRSDRVRQRRHRHDTMAAGKGEEPEASHDAPPRRKHGNAPRQEQQQSPPLPSARPQRAGSGLERSTHSLNSHNNMGTSNANPPEGPRTAATTRSQPGSSLDRYHRGDSTLVVSRSCDYKTSPNPEYALLGEFHSGQLQQQGTSRWPGSSTTPLGSPSQRAATAGALPGFGTTPPLPLSSSSWRSSSTIGGGGGGSSTGQLRTMGTAEAGGGDCAPLARPSSSSLKEGRSVAGMLSFVASTWFCVHSAANATGSSGGLGPSSAAGRKDTSGTRKGSPGKDLHHERERHDVYVGQGSFGLSHPWVKPSSVTRTDVSLCGANVVDSDLKNGYLILELTVADDVLPGAYWSPHLLVSDDGWKLLMGCFAGRDDRLSLSPQDALDDFTSDFRAGEAFCRTFSGITEDGRTLVLPTHSSSAVFQSPEEVLFLYAPELFSAVPHDNAVRARVAAARQLHTLTEPASAAGDDGAAPPPPSAPPPSPPSERNREGEDLAAAAAAAAEGSLPTAGLAHSLPMTVVSAVTDDDMKAEIPNLSSLTTTSMDGQIAATTMRDAAASAAAATVPELPEIPTPTAALPRGDSHVSSQSHGVVPHTHAESGCSPPLLALLPIGTAATVGYVQLRNGLLFAIQPTSPLPTEDELSSAVAAGVSASGGDGANYYYYTFHSLYAAILHGLIGGGGGGFHLHNAPHAGGVGAAGGPGTSTATAAPTTASIGAGTSVMSAAGAAGAAGGGGGGSVAGLAAATATMGLPQSMENITTRVVLRRRWLFQHPDIGLEAPATASWSRLCASKVLPLYGSKSVYPRDSFYTVSPHQYTVSGAAATKPPSPSSIGPMSGAATTANSAAAAFSVWSGGGEKDGGRHRGNAGTLTITGRALNNAQDEDKKRLLEFILQRLQQQYQIIVEGGAGAAYPLLWPRADPQPNIRLDMSIGHQTHTLKVGETARTISITRKLHRGMYSNGQVTHMVSYRYALWNYLRGTFDQREMHMEAQVGEKNAYCWEALDRWVQERPDAYIPRGTELWLRSREIAVVLLPENPDNPPSFDEFHGFIGYRFSNYLSTRGRVRWHLNSAPLSVDVPSPTPADFPAPLSTMPVVLVRDNSRAALETRSLVDHATGRTVAFDRPVDERLMSVDIVLPAQYNRCCHYLLKVSWLACAANIVTDWYGSFIANAQRYRFRALPISCYNHNPKAESLAVHYDVSAAVASSAVAKGAATPAVVPPPPPPPASTTLSLPPEIMRWHASEHSGGGDKASGDATAEESGPHATASVEAENTEEEPILRRHLLTLLTERTYHYYPDIPAMNRNCRLVHFSGLCYVVVPPSRTVVAQWYQNTCVQQGTLAQQRLLGQFRQAVKAAKKATKAELRRSAST